MGRRCTVLVLIMAVLVVSPGCGGAGDSSAPSLEETRPPPATVPVPGESPAGRADKWAQGAAPTRAVFHMAVGPRQAYQMLQEGRDIVLLDLRSAEEAASGRIPGTEVRMDSLAPDFTEELDGLDRNRTYMLYCRAGERSAAAMTVMEEMGFERVYEIEGGIEAWAQEGLPVER
ncbi:MAG: rhodanese-like domain-containing protein [Acidobacteria bacterium]|nr:rhodanese-like domain-containing protein [Acidobacteriota bacterium]